MRKFIEDVRTAFLPEGIERDREIELASRVAGDSLREHGVCRFVGHEEVSTNSGSAPSRWRSFCGSDLASRVIFSRSNPGTSQSHRRIDLVQREKGTVSVTPSRGEPGS